MIKRNILVNYFIFWLANIERNTLLMYEVKQVQKLW